MSKPSGVVNIARRTWDHQVYLKKAEERAKRELDSIEEQKERKQKGPPKLSDMKPATARETSEVDFQSMAGKKQVAPPPEGSDQRNSGPGFYCKVCDCTMKDSANYLDHINGRKHQKMAGTALQPERATVDQVRARLKANKESKLPSSELRGLDKSKEVKEEKKDDLEERLERARQEEQRKKEEKKQRDKEFKLKREEEKRKQLEEELDPEMANFGLPMGFGSSKK
eukprot:TRINITY_DN12166_c0_g1_i1.p1 TRINITY_DN12166_c0_g1~~TRINITY_DN12166_c0_g1_i1.p1  ORF type:complete len:226 (-),score=60.07 TRINITY_DN12166_c0_g1_i1:49-726(-)